MIPSPAASTRAASVRPDAQVAVSVTPCASIAATSARSTSSAPSSPGARTGRSGGSATNVSYGTSGGRYGMGVSSRRPRAVPPVSLEAQLTVNDRRH